MYSRVTPLRALLAAALFAALAAPALAQQSQTEKLEIRVADIIDNLSRPDAADKRVLVLAFPEKRGTVSEFGEFFAAQFSAALARRRPQVEFIDRATLREYLDKQKISIAQLLKPKIAESVAKDLQARYLVTGWSEPEEQSVSLHIEIYDYLQGGMIGLEKGKLKKTKEIEEALARPAPEFDAAPLSPVKSEHSTERPVKPGQDGVGYPECTYCPDPRFPAEGQGKVTQGTVLLEVTIDADGRARDIKVQKGLVRELDQNAIEVVRTWRFRPAYGKDGRPVPVKILIEVTFRLLPKK